jgi:protein O-GlcNAc transferase
MNDQLPEDLAEAIQLLQTGRPAEAAAACLRLLERGERADPLALLAVIRLGEGDLKGAADCYSRIVAIAPGSFEAHENLGLTFAWQKQYEAALASFRRALALRPDRAEAHNNIGNALFALNRIEPAIESFRKAATIQPGLAQAHFNLGAALASAGRHQEAVSSYRAAIAAAPGFAEAHNNLGISLRATENTPAAIESFRRAVELEPDFAQAHNNLGNALGATQNHAAALDCYRRATELQPDFAEAHHNHANALLILKRPADAVASYERAVALKRGFVEAHVNLGNTLVLLKRHEAALRAFQAALGSQPELFAATIGAGQALHALQRYDDALPLYTRALELKPGDPEAHCAMGGALFMLERYDEALTHYRGTLAAMPDHAVALGGSAYLLRQTCDWQDGGRSEAALLDQVRAATVTVEPFMFLAFTDDPALQLACARQHWQSRNVPSTPHVRRTGPRHDKLRLGYLSGNFRISATAFLTAQLYELHDRSRFEVLGLSYGPDEDSSMRRRLKAGFDHLFDLQRASDDDIIRTIREQEIDIVIDLKGYQKHSRMDVLARRPAPIQVHYICHPGSLGVDFIDYALVDRFLVPPEAEPHFSEKLAFLPDAYLITDQKREFGTQPTTRAHWGLPERAFVFCCFNNSYKITPAIFDVWMRLLIAVPGSVLWLIADNAWAESNLRREAQARGVAADRLVFAPRVKLPEHLARHSLADLFIDTWPYCAHTTAIDALWAGLPLVTLTGRSFASRVAGSLLRASGLSWLVTDTLADYEDLALRLAREPDLLARAKRQLSGDLAHLPAFDAPRKTRQIERAYQQMWHVWERGEPPQSFEVDKDA